MKVCRTKEGGTQTLRHCPSPLPCGFLCQLHGAILFVTSALHSPSFGCLASADWSWLLGSSNITVLLVLVVVAVFVGCWTPVQVFVLVQGLGVQPGSETAVAILRFCTALGYVNSGLNPILYAFLDENFKACFRKFCCASTLRREMQVSDRVRSIAKAVALAHKTAETVPRPA